MKIGIGVLALAGITGLTTLLEPDLGLFGGDGKGHPSSQSLAGVAQPLTESASAAPPPEQAPMADAAAGADETAKQPAATANEDGAASISASRPGVSPPRNGRKPAAAQDMQADAGTVTTKGKEAPPAQSATEAAALHCSDCGAVESVEPVYPARYATDEQASAAATPDQASGPEARDEEEAPEVVSYRIRVRMQDGSQVVVYLPDHPSLSVGAPVKVRHGTLVPLI